MERNWAGNHEYAGARLERPASLDELADIVAAVPRVRAIGSRHSFTDIVDSDVLVSLEAVPPVFDLDAEARTVTIGGGARYGEVSRALHDRGWALANLASLLPSASDSPSYDPRWLAHCEDNLMLYLLCHRPNSVRRRHDALRLGSEATGLRQLQRAEEFMRSRLDAALSLEDVADAAGVSRRTLAQLFRRHRELSPMEVLRNMRLDAAHAQLARHDGASVTQIALDCGFSHLSRFAACYRERFGQLPRETSKH